MRRRGSRVPGFAFLRSRPSKPLLLRGAGPSVPWRRLGTPPGQGGIQILAAVTVVDVAFPGSLFSGSHLFGVSPEEYMSWISGR